MWCWGEDLPLEVSEYVLQSIIIALNLCVLFWMVFFSCEFFFLVTKKSHKGAYSSSPGTWGWILFLLILLVYLGRDVTIDWLSFGSSFNAFFWWFRWYQSNGMILLPKLGQLGTQKWNAEMVPRFLFGTILGPFWDHQWDLRLDPEGKFVMELCGRKQTVREALLMWNRAQERWAICSFKIQYRFVNELTMCTYIHIYIYI